MTKRSCVAVALVGIVVLAGSVAAQQSAPPLAAPRPSPFSEAGAIFTSNCAGCHGADLAGGRSPSVFADALLSKRSDAALRQTIEDGIEAVGMPAFKGKLTEEQIGHLLVYMRLRGGQLRGRPSFLPNPDGQIVRSEKQTFRVEVVAANLSTPWGAAFLPDGRMLVTERTGHIRILDKTGKLEPEPVKNTPAAWVRQDGGYFDIALHPQYARNGWIYLSYSEILPGFTGEIPSRGNQGLPPSMTRVVRGRINDRNEWVDEQELFRASAALYTPSVIHYGSRFLFDGQGHLFWTLGDRGDFSNAQNLSSPLGKIHRINDDGTIPADNPFVKTPGALPSIWSYGHRNPQGLAFDPATGLLWETEHGPTGGDEINIVEKGHNYGWGVVSKGLQAGITKQRQEGMDEPIAYYTPSIGPSGIRFYTGDRYPGWKGNLFVSALAGQRLLRFDIKGREILSQEAVYQGIGRTREVLIGPDGLLYILLQNSQSLANSPGMVIRLVPQSDAADRR